ncbi:MAG: hypothetical protein ACF787_12615, partial [Rhodopirellula sp. JB053]
MRSAAGNSYSWNNGRRLLGVLVTGHLTPFLLLYDHNMRRNRTPLAPPSVLLWGRAGMTAILAFAFLVPADVVSAQGMALPSSSVSRSQPPSTQSQGGFVPRAADTPPSLQTPPSQNNSSVGAGGQLSSGGQLPRGAGQEHRVYDLRPYTGYLTTHDRPHQAVVDWIVRETGTDVWHTEPFGFMSADRDGLTVYHTNEMHQVIAGIVDRFVAGDKDPQVMNLKVMTVGNPNWRSRAHLLMQHVNVQSPGIQAWLLTKENAALVMNLLRQRTDVRQVQAVDLIMHNGQTEKLASTRGRNYVINVKPSPA